MGNVDGRVGAWMGHGSISALTQNHESEHESQNRKHNIIFISDSHVRGCASELTQILDESYKVTAFVKPGAGILILVDTAKEEINSSTKEGVLIFWGGTKGVT
jgi:hypothetical protein